MPGVSKQSAEQITFLFSKMPDVIATLPYSYARRAVMGEIYAQYLDLWPVEAIPTGVVLKKKDTPMQKKKEVSFSHTSSRIQYALTSSNDSK